MLFFCYATHNAAAIKQFKAWRPFNLIDEQSIVRKFVQEEFISVDFYCHSCQQFFVMRSIFLQPDSAVSNALPF